MDQQDEQNWKLWYYERPFWFIFPPLDVLLGKFAERADTSRFVRWLLFRRVPEGNIATTPEQRLLALEHYGFRVGRKARNNHRYLKRTLR